MKKGQTLLFTKKISISETSSIVGRKEGEGPISDYFDRIVDDALFGEESWEKAESRFAYENFKNLIDKSGLKKEEIDYLIAGDLLNQLIGSTFASRELNIPFLGVYSACASFGSSLTTAGVFIEAGLAKHIICGVSSHFCSAEKQFRFPLELGTQRPQTAQWTVTGGGAALISDDLGGPYIKSATIGKIVDLGVKDANNMGAAMAPAAADTIISHFKDTGYPLDYYDSIFTGDLGYVGSDLLNSILKKERYDILIRHNDCGQIIFDREKQDTHAGGSGCACSATTFSGFIYNKLKKKELNKILLVPTGALLSLVSTQQGETIPCIAHAVGIEN